MSKLIVGPELQRIREKISCPQLGDDHYGLWGAMTLEQRVTMARLVYTIEYLDKMVEQHMKGDVRAEAIAEYHEEVKKRCIEGGIYPAFVERVMSNVKAEMVGDADGR